MTDSSRFRLALLVVTLGSWVMCLPQLSHGAAAQATPKPRVVVTADPELDEGRAPVLRDVIRVPRRER